VLEAVFAPALVLVLLELLMSVAGVDTGPTGADESRGGDDGRRGAELEDNVEVEVEAEADADAGV
jgi:hypothetical protein